MPREPYTVLCARGKTGFLQQDSESRKYRLGLKIYELGMILAGTLEINDKAVGPTSQLAKRTGLVTKVAIWDGNSALLVLNIDPRAHSLFTHQIGPSIPGYCSALGKAMLAHLKPEELNAYLDRTQLVPYTSETIVDKKVLLKDLEETRQEGLRHRSRGDGPGFQLHRGANRAGAQGGGRGRQPLRQRGAVVSEQAEKREAVVKQLLIAAGQKISRALGYYGRVMPKD